MEILEHLTELSGQESVRVGQREEERLDVQAFGRGVSGIAGDRRLMQTALPGEHVNRVCIVPGARRYRRIRQVAVDQYPRGALEATVDERDQKAVSGQEDPPLGLVRKQVFVRRDELRGENQRSLGGLECIAGKRVRRASEMALERGPERQRSCVVFFRKLHPPRIGDSDPVDRRKCVPDRSGRLDRIALEHFIEPRDDAPRPCLRRMRRTLLEAGKTQREGHDVGIFLVALRL